ncbi:hypothetical protein B4N89_45695 [Embleya scabrispora]|uniref:TniQ domain-containing protein n=1 Tax=Embleya scabrispora TaxID=159449 RepID=A0A1T3NIY7_9ACTN|nr:TniQ family protein [Embleya scabrispora]OPC76773.1 hypothetical protein B4N89_45695 [Embleya scabrispora]
MTAESNSDDRLRPLPARPRPRSGESTDSYIRRLAHANHLKPSYLRGYLAGPPDYGYGNRPKAERLAVVTGRQQASLERALIDLAPRKPTEPDQPAKPKRRVTLSADKPALFAAIRRDAHAEHLTVTPLAKRNRVHNRTVVQALSSPNPPPRKPRTLQENPALDRVRPALDAILDEYAAKHCGHLPSTRLIWERLLDEYDADVSYATIRRFLSGHPLKNPNGVTSTPGRPAGNFLAATQQTLQAGMVRHYRGMLAAVRQQPAMHGIDGSFATTTAFVLGCDAGSSWGMLTGFHEWLVTRLGKGHDLTWPVLVRHLTPAGWVHPLTPHADIEAVATLFQLLAEFLDQREQPDGLAEIFRTYQSWLNTQSWHHFETPPPNQID